MGHIEGTQQGCCRSDGYRSPLASGEETETRAARPHQGTEPVSGNTRPPRASSREARCLPPFGPHLSTLTHPERPLCRQSNASWQLPHGSRASLGIPSNLVISVYSCRVHIPVATERPRWSGGLSTQISVALRFLTVTQERRVIWISKPPPLSVISTLKVSWLLPRRGHGD